MTSKNQIAEIGANYASLDDSLNSQVQADSCENNLPTGYKNTEVGIIPDDWVVLPLEEFTSFISYGFTNPMPTTTSGPYMITARDISNGKIQFKEARNTDPLAFDKLLTPKSKPKKNDLLLTKDGTLGRTALVGDELVCINQSVAILRPNQKIYPEFFKLLLESPFYQERMLEDAGGSTIKHIYITIVNRMPLGLPISIQEQTAIANALSDVDALINALEKLIAKKQAIKTATMQQLLTGKTRLPQFATHPDGTPKVYKQTELGEIPEDWDIVFLASVCGSFKTGKLDANAMKSDGEYRFYTCAREYYFIDKYAFDTEALLISGNGANVGYIHYYKGKFNAYQRTYVLSGFSASIGYLKTYLERKLSDRIRVEVNAGNTPYITMDTLTEMSVILPKDKDEQSCISVILSDMDSAIMALEKRLVKTRQIKQGMMQELLTGKTRLVKPVSGSC